MKKRITAFSTILLILLSNAGSLFASSNAGCSMKHSKDDNHCEMMEMKMDCCPSKKPADEKCNCPEMNNSSQDRATADLFIPVNLLENHGMIIVQCSNLNHFEDQLTKRPFTNLYKPTNPDKKIYKTIQSFLI